MPRKSPAPDAEHQNKEPRRRAKRAAAPASSEEAAMAVPTPELQPEPTAPELIAPELAEPRLAEPALPPTEPAEPAPAEPPRVEGPGIWIELDSGVPFGLSDDRFDIWLRGRVLSTDPVVEVRLLADERLFSATAYGHPEGMMIAATPNAAPTWQVGFQLNLPRPRHGAAGASDFRILARTETGQEHVQDYTLDFNPDTGHGVLVSGPTNPALAHTPARPHAIVYIERAMLDQDGVLSVSGWALAMRPILALQVHADEERVGDARFGERREDVAAAHPSFPNARQSGFSLVCTLDPLDINAACVRVQVVCRDGFGQTVVVPIHRVTERLRPAIAPAAVPKAETAAEPPTPVFNLLNQKPAYSLQTDFRIAEEPVIGFVLTTPALRAAAADAPARPETQKPEAPKPEAPKPSTEIRMFCDAVSLSGDGVLDVSGWAVCGIGIAQVRVLFDDETAGLAVYGHDRNDVGSAFPEIPHAMMSGFTFRQRVANRTEGEHTVRVIVRNLTGGEKEETLLTTATATRAAADLPLSSAPGEPTASTMATIEADSFVPTAEQEREFKFELDSPKLVSGAVPELITGRLTIDGWLLTRSGIASFEVFVDDQKLGDMHYGLARQDVGTAFPEWPNALRSGFAFHCPPRGLKDGDHTVRLLVKAKNGVTIDRSFRLTVKKSEEDGDQGGFRRRVPRVEADMMLAMLDKLAFRPHLRFVLRQNEQIDIGAINRALDSLRLLAWDDWSVLMLASDVRVAAALSIIVDETMSHLAERFAIVSAEDDEAWDKPLAAGTEGRNTLHLLLLPGDELGADAGLELAAALARHPDAHIAYGDELRISPVSHEQEPFFKPDFSPDLLTSMNYFGRPWAVTDAVLAGTGATPRSLFARGEYDLALHCADLAGAIRHVPKLLCQTGSGQSEAGRGDTAEQERAALLRMAERRGLDATVEATPIPGTWRLKRSVQTKALVSIIIPTCAANGYIRTCLNSLRARTAYENYEIIVVDNIPPTEATWKNWVKQNADKIVDMPEAFNWSVFNNRAAAEASGEFLLFLNDDITITDHDWLDALLEHAQRPEVGIVGPQLLYPDGKVQHAGMFLANNGIGRHAFRFAMYDDPCYFGLALTQRDVMAVTGACMLVRKETFEALGRFDEAHQIVNNDLDYCLRSHQAGLLTVYTPYASMTHHELASRAYMKDVFDLTHFNAQWKTTFAAGDPYFNPRLWRHADDYRPDDEPVQSVVSGSPLFHREEIRRILVVKLDHIGDFVTALPPIRRLKTLFPEAHITVLAGPASRAFVGLEPAIDAFIPFAFFHARSQLGERELTPDDYRELSEQLRSHRFDLAVDLRKHHSTRDVLKYTGARFLAGFDFQGQYPNLDVALDWDGDRNLQRKRNHIVDDLMALVNAIGHASESDRVVMKAPPEPMPLADMPPEVAALFAKPVVAVHPGAGNITKQWPEAHFAALIDLLVERNGVNVMLVGGPDEVEIAKTVMGHVLHAEAIASMAGKTSLAALPALLRTCALYIGNDSGPKHIAAAAGVPTIGIHSGVVDPVEWGPIGPNAVALRRNMNCSPCYLAKAEDCPRGLACLNALEPNLVYETADRMLAHGDEDAPSQAAETSSGQAAESAPAEAAPPREGRTAPSREGRTAPSREGRAAPSRKTARRGTAKRETQPQTVDTA